MASSRKKYTRARIRSQARRRSRRGGAQWFYAAIAVIVIAGIGLIVVSRSSTADDVPPQPGNPSTGEPGDHWHAAFAVNVCGQWLPSPPEFETVADNPNVRVGVHTHGDGFIHIHPFTKSEGGDNATVGRFLRYGGWSASEDSLSLWSGPAADPEKTEWSNGDKCPPGTPYAGQTGVVKWSLDCRDQDGNPSDYKPADRDVIALAFVPRNEEIGVPPNASAAPEDDGGDTTPLDVKGCTTAVPGEQTTTTTTAPAEVPETTVETTPPAP